MLPAEWRQSGRLSLARVAKMLGCGSASTVLRYETGERDAPNLTVLAYERASNQQVRSEDLERVRLNYLDRRARPRSSSRAPRSRTRS